MFSPPQLIVLSSITHHFLITNSSFYQNHLQKHVFRPSVKDVKEGESTHPSQLQAEYKQVTAP
jgi:hypothetical protein